jgi:hypothetical protein
VEFQMRPSFPALRLPSLAFALFASAGAAWAGSVPTTECQRDLLVADSDMRASQAKLASMATAPQKDLCPVWRKHVDLAKNASSIYRRCLTGTDQRVKTADMNATAADFEQALASACK